MNNFPCLLIRLNWDWKYALNFGDLYGMQIYILHASMSDNKFWLERLKFYCMITLAFWFVILIFTRNENNNAFFGQDFTPLRRGLTYTIGQWIYQTDKSQPCAFFLRFLPYNFQFFGVILDPTTYPKIWRRLWQFLREVFKISYLFTVYFWNNWINTKASLRWRLFINWLPFVKKLSLFALVAQL